MNQTSPAKLERRARILLHAYPADYRRDRAEEVIATLLEATPRGRAYPSGRDSWALIAAGRPALGLSIAVLLMISYWDTNILLSRGEPPSYGLIVVLLLLLATSLVIVLGVTRLLYRHAAPVPRPLP